ncbi:MAG TPA: hypothetical protein VN802_12620 [Stellaceae bacterium]|nr:hypothetical protein [Stellaceae bacterium]
MTPPVIPALSLAVLLVAQSPPAGKAQSLADLYGQTLGAAAECKTIAAARLVAVAEKAAERIKALTGGDEAAAAAATSLGDGIERGHRAVASGAESCAQAASEFANLEHELGP